MAGFYQRLGFVSTGEVDSNGGDRSAGPHSRRAHGPQVLRDWADTAIAIKSSLLAGRRMAA